MRIRYVSNLTLKERTMRKDFMINALSVINTQPGKIFPQ